MAEELRSIDERFIKNPSGFYYFSVCAIAVSITDPLHTFAHPHNVFAAEKAVMDEPSSRPDAQFFEGSIRARLVMPDFRIVHLITKELTFKEYCRDFIAFRDKRRIQQDSFTLI